MKKFWNKNKPAIKSYLRAVLASAVTMGLALAADLAPQYAIIVGSIAAPWPNGQTKLKRNSA